MDFHTVADAVWPPVASFAACVKNLVAKRLLSDASPGCRMLYTQVAAVLKGSSAEPVLKQVSGSAAP